MLLDVSRVNSCFQEMQTNKQRPAALLQVPLSRWICEPLFKDLAEAEGIPEETYVKFNF